MPLVLRKISKSRWFVDKPWLQLHDLNADAAKDLATSDGTLSIFLIDGDKSQLDRVIAALSANGNKPDNVDYALVDLQLLTALGFKTEETPGATPDSEVNAWHRDVVDLSIMKLLRFALLIRDQAERNRVPRPKVIKLVKEGITAGYLDQNRISVTYLQKIGLDSSADDDIA